MTTKTDVSSVMGLIDAYVPKQMGVVSADEEKLICKMLELDTRSDLELQNTRDVTVMLYGRTARSDDTSASARKLMETMDAMSAICTVIDQEKLRRELSV